MILHRYLRMKNLYVKVFEDARLYVDLVTSAKGKFDFGSAV